MAVNSFSLFLPSFIDWLLDSGWSLWLFGRREITGQLMKKSLALLDLTLIFLSKYTKAFKAMKLCCRASCKHVLLFFKLVDTKTGVDLKRYVEKICYNSSQLLHFLNYLGCQNAKLQREIVRSLETWSDAGRQFSMLLVPVMLVKVWVKITVVKNRGVKDGSAQTISNLLISSKQATKRTREIILELGAYEEFCDIGREFCDIMILEIFKILKEDLTTTEVGCFLLIGKKSTQNKCLQESRILLRIGLAFRAKGMDHYIWYLSEAIIKMDGATCSGGTPLCHQLAVAYYLRAICSLEAKPNSKQVTQDINAAVKRWTSILITAPSELDDIFTEIIRLLCYIVDLLSLKGFLKSLPVTYELMIKLFKWNSIPLEKCLAILCESRRLSHALCVSPLSEAFIEKLAEVHCGRSFMSVDYWRKELQLCLDGFKQTLSFRIDDAEKVPQSPRSAFMDGYLCYDLCQKLILNGHLSEALSYAKEAYELRFKLFNEKFLYYNMRQSKDVSDAVLIQVKPSVDSKVWCFDDEPWKVDSCYISPWNVLRCYLESTLQVGQVYELVGNGEEAEFYLLCGKEISYSQSLPIFKVVFSSLLGKINHKKQLWKQAEDELMTARRLLENSAEFSCIKCSLMLVATVEQLLGDLATSDFPWEAETHYYKAQRQLNSSMWKNIISCPQKAECNSIYYMETVRATECGACNTMELTRVKPNAAMEANLQILQQDEGLAKNCNICNNMMCWQCLPTEVIESGSVNDLINMKWELVRRKLSLTILDGLGVIYFLQSCIHRCVYTNMLVSAT